MASVLIGKGIQSNLDSQAVLKVTRSIEDACKQLINNVNSGSQSFARPGTLILSKPLGQHLQDGWKLKPIGPIRVRTEMASFFQVLGLLPSDFNFDFNRLLIDCLLSSFPLSLRSLARRRSDPSSASQ